MRVAVAVVGAVAVVVLALAACGGDDGGGGSEVEVPPECAHPEPCRLNRGLVCRDLPGLGALCCDDEAAQTCWTDPATGERGCRGYDEGTCEGPLPFFGACLDDADCESGWRCLAINGLTQCSTECDVDRPCPAGYRCVDTTGGWSTCEIN